MPQLKDFSYHLPPELIAKHPCDKRDDSRLLSLNKTTGKTEHKTFKNIVNYFKTGDVLVFNDSKVFPCRLITKRKTGGRQEILLLRNISRNQRSPRPLPALSLSNGRERVRERGEWEIMVNASHKVRKGDVFEFDGFQLTILDETGNTREALIESDGPLMPLLEKQAQIPLPPYINRKADEGDKTRYQTVYANQEGSTAAPTAGLHFTNDLLNKLKDKGVIFAKVTLHVGPGTFLPVRVDNIKDHKMHTEHFSISQETCDVINLAKKEDRTITAVGTTTTRVLETLGRKKQTLTPTTDSTNIFIYPPYDFKIIDRLITNFHLPESTLLMLVSAFAGREKILAAYDEAIKLKYRLFSYGDAMVIY